MNQHNGKALPHVLFLFVSPSTPFASSQTRWSGFVWLSCPGFGWPTGGSSLSWRAPPGPQTAAGAACYAAGRCCWHRGSSSIWCPEVCLSASHTYSFTLKYTPVFTEVVLCVSQSGFFFKQWVNTVSSENKYSFKLNRLKWISCLLTDDRTDLSSFHPFISLSNSCVFPTFYISLQIFNYSVFLILFCSSSLSFCLFYCSIFSTFLILFYFRFFSLQTLFCLMAPCVLLLSSLSFGHFITFCHCVFMLISMPFKWCLLSDCLRAAEVNSPDL